MWNWNFYDLFNFYDYYTALQNYDLFAAYQDGEMVKVEELVSGSKDTKYAIVSVSFNIAIHFFKWLVYNIITRLWDE